MSVVDNNGKVYMIEKMEDYEFEKSIPTYKRLRKNIIKAQNNNEFDKLVDKFIKDGRIELKVYE